MDVITDDSPDVVLINGGGAFHKVCKVMNFLLRVADYFGLVVQGYMGVRNNEGGHEGMGSAADAADPHTDSLVKDLDAAEVISMDMEACRVPTGACELVELKVDDKSIIFILDILSMGIAIKIEQGYHNNCRAAGIQLWKAEFLLFLCCKRMITYSVRKTI